MKMHGIQWIALCALLSLCGTSVMAPAMAHDCLREEFDTILRGGGNGGIPSPFYDGSTRDLVAGADLTFVGQLVAGKQLNIGEPSATPDTDPQPYLEVTDSDQGVEYFPLEGGWPFWANFYGMQIEISAEVRVYQAYGDTWNDVRQIFVLRPLGGSTVHIVTGPTQ